MGLDYSLVIPNTLFFLLFHRSSCCSPFSIIFKTSLLIRSDHLVFVLFSPHWDDLSFLSQTWTNFKIGVEDSHCHKIYPDNKCWFYSLPTEQKNCFRELSSAIFIGNTTLGSGLVSVVLFNQSNGIQKLTGHEICLCPGFAGKPQSSYWVLFLTLLIQPVCYHTWYMHSNTSHARGLRFLMIKILVKAFCN